MQMINHYKGLLQENLKLVTSFINSVEEYKIPAVERRYEKAKKRAKTS
jgi:hypothetical protein